jgi:hypothetical protein
MTRDYERVTCPGCQRTISAYVPHLGDGSGLRVVKHNRVRATIRGSVKCSYSNRIIVRRMGRWELE